MSDSASKKDVEDVLTSVRRLVSGDLPRTRKPVLSQGPGALVLTDAQRVKRPPSRAEASKSLEERIAELELAVSTRTDEYEPDGSEDQSVHRPSRIVYTRPPSDNEEAEARGMTLRLRQLSVVDTGDEDAEDEVGAAMPALPFRHSRVSEAEATEAEGEAFAGDELSVEPAPMAEDVQPVDEPAEVRPFHDPDDMVERFEARISGGGPAAVPGPGHNGGPEPLERYREPKDEAPAAAEAWAEDAGPAQTEMDEAPAGFIAQEATYVSVDDAEFEAALNDAVSGKRPGATSSEPSDEAETADSADQAQARDEASLEDHESGAQDAEASGDEDLLAAIDIDEDLLRPIVAKLIRQELQGDLGERITRNVRKLVRNEIMRALASRDVE